MQLIRYLAVLICTLGFPALAQTPAATPGAYVTVALGFQQITAITASTALVVPAGSTYCLVVAQTATVFWRDDGTAPTSSIAMPLLTTSPGIVFTGAANLAAVRFISATGGIDVSCYKTLRILE